MKTTISDSHGSSQIIFRIKNYETYLGIKKRFDIRSNLDLEPFSCKKQRNNPGKSWILSVKRLSQDLKGFLKKFIFLFFAWKTLWDNDESKYKIYFSNQNILHNFKHKNFERDHGNFENIVFIFFFIYFAAICLSKPSWEEHRYGVADVSKCLLRNNWRTNVLIEETVFIFNKTNCNWQWAKIKLN